MDTIGLQVDMSFLNQSDRQWIMDTADELCRNDSCVDKERISQMLYSYLALRNITQ